MFGFALKERIEINSRGIVIYPAPFIKLLEDNGHPLLLIQKDTFITMRVVFQRLGLVATGLLFALLLWLRRLGFIDSIIYLDADAFRLHISNFVFHIFLYDKVASYIYAAFAEQLDYFFLSHFLSLFFNIETYTICTYMLHLILDILFHHEVATHIHIYFGRLMLGQYFFPDMR